MLSISPVRWDPPPRAPFEGRFAANDRLAAVELWPTPAEGPEDVAADSRGFLYTGTVDGSILRFSPGGGDPELLFNSGGRPWGSRSMWKIGLSYAMPIAGFSVGRAIPLSCW